MLIVVVFASGMMCLDTFAGPQHSLSFARSASGGFKLPVVDLGEAEQLTDDDDVGKAVKPGGLEAHVGDIGPSGPAKSYLGQSVTLRDVSKPQFVLRCYFCKKTPQAILVS